MRNTSLENPANEKNLDKREVQRMTKIDVKQQLINLHRSITLWLLTSMMNSTLNPEINLCLYLVLHSPMSRCC